MKSHAYHIHDIFLSLEGMDVAQYDETFLINSANRRFSETNCASIEDYLELLENSELERMIYFDNLQIGYSTFFRNALTFDTLEKIILPELVSNVRKNNTKDLRVWSAACAAGQEAYSIAMLIEEEMACSEKGKCNCLIFATDRDEEQIETARRGQYARHALENLKLKQLDKWFINYGSTYFIKPELKVNINFSVFDLFDKNYSSPPTSIFGYFDLVFCANLLFYYKENHRKTILDKITGAMNDNGYLVTGETERDILKKYHFREVYPHSAIFRKG